MNHRIAKALMAAAIGIGLISSTAASCGGSGGTTKTTAASPTSKVAHPKKTGCSPINSITHFRVLTSRVIRNGDDGAYFQISVCINTKPASEDRWDLWGFTTTDHKNYVFASGNGEIRPYHDPQSFTDVKWHAVPLGDPGKHNQRVTVLVILATPSCRTVLNGILPGAHSRRVISKAYLDGHCPGYGREATFTVMNPPTS